MNPKRKRLMKIRDDQQKQAAPAMVEFIRVVRDQELKLESVRQPAPQHPEVVVLSYR